MKSAIHWLISDMREAEYLTQADMKWVEGRLLDYAIEDEPTEGKPINLLELKLWVIKERDSHASNDPTFDGFMVALCNKIDELITRTEEKSI